MVRRKEDVNKVEVGNIRYVSGEMNIAGGNIYKGFTAEQVSILIKQITTTFVPKTFDGICPYKGLDIFEEFDADLFFGREKLVNDLVDRVEESRTLFITGPSGSGKSSLVRAGLFHALQRGALKGSKNWLYATIKPGRDPFAALANAFSQLTKSPDIGDYILNNSSMPSVLHKCTATVLSGRNNQQLVLFIDQFEEIFTQLSVDKAESFISVLGHAANVEKSRIILLFAMRSDFVSNCVAFPQLNALLNQHFVQIGAMLPGELVNAIAQPALRVGLHIDPDLIAQIIADMKDEPGALPLMQFAMKDLFEFQQVQGGHIALKLEDYLARGGIHNALERHANASFGKLEKYEQELARSIFSGLIEIGYGTQYTRRSASFDELIPANTNVEVGKLLIDKLVNARLITTDESNGRDTVTISHEKLIDAWPWLKKLVNENRETIALKNEIVEDAKEWEEEERDPSYLYSGAKLSFAQEKVKERTIVLNELALDFLESGLTLQETEKKAKETLRKRVAFGLILGLLISLVLAAFSMYQMFDAQKQARTAHANELAALALSSADDHLDIALLFAIEAFHTVENQRTRTTLLTSVNSHAELEKFLWKHTGSVVDLAFSPDGKILASGSEDKTVILWDMSNPSNPLVLSVLGGNSYGISSLVFSPDGKILATGSFDSTVVLWNMSNPNSPTKINSFQSKDGVSSLAFSPNGKILAAGSFRTSVVLWDVSNPSMPSVAAAPTVQNGVSSIAYSPDGKTLAAAGFDNVIYFWDVGHIDAPQQLATLTSHKRSVFAIVYSPDGKYLATGDANRTIILWDVSNPRVPVELKTIPGNGNTIFSLAFNTTGNMLASAGDDNTIVLWEISNPVNPFPLTTFKGHSDAIMDISFNPEGNILVSGGQDTAIILWNINESTLLQSATSGIGKTTFLSGLKTLINGDNHQPNRVAFSPDGVLLASGGGTSSVGNVDVTLWDVSTPAFPLKVSTLNRLNVVTSIAFSPDGRYFASGGGKNIFLWEISEPKSPSLLATISESNYFSKIAFNSRGNLLAAATYENIVILWDVTNSSAPNELAKLPSQKGLISIAFSPDGTKLATAGNSIIVWDVTEPRQPTQLVDFIEQEYRGTAQIVFSPDGKTMAVGYGDSTISLWDVSHLESPVLISNLNGHNSNIWSVAFSPDGKTLVSGGLDHTISLWDVTNLKEPAQIAVFRGHADFVNELAFNPKGTLLASGGGDGAVLLWDLDPNSWVNKSCQRAGRNFTSREWAQYFPNDAYRKTCEQFPSEFDVTADSITVP